MSKIRIITRPLEKLLDVVQGITVSIGALIALGIGLLMFYMVIARYFFDYNFDWGSTILTGMLVWGNLLMVGSVARRRQHISIGFFAKLFFKKRAPIIQYTIENFLALPLAIWLAWASWSWVDETRDLGLIKFVGTDTYDAWIPTAVLPIGFTVAALFYLERCVRQLHGLYIRLRQSKDTSSSNLEESYEGGSQ